MDSGQMQQQILRDRLYKTSKESQIVTMMTNPPNALKTFFSRQDILEKRKINKIQETAPPAISFPRRASTGEPEVKKAVIIDKPTIDSSDTDIIEWIFNKRKALGLECSVLPSLRPKDVKNLFRCEKLNTAEVFSPSAKPPSGRKTSLRPEEFVYCLPIDSLAFYNPYDIRLSSPEEARGARVCWTVSATAILRYERDEKGNEDSLRQDTMEWLSERQLFLKLREMPFVQHCWLRRCFLAWSRDVKRNKSLNAKEFLTKELYFANEVFLRCFHHSHAACVRAASTMSLCSLNADTASSLSLTDFMSQQHERLTLVSKEIQNVRSYIVECAWQACLIIAERENIFLVSTPEEVQGLRYSDMTVWRRKLARHIKFLHLLDYVLLEFGFNLVMQSLRSLSRFVVDSAEAGLSKDEEKMALKTAVLSVKLVLEPPKMKAEVNDDELNEELKANARPDSSSGYAYEYTASAVNSTSAEASVRLEPSVPSVIQAFKLLLETYEMIAVTDVHSLLTEERLAPIHSPPYASLLAPQTDLLKIAPPRSTSQQVVTASARPALMSNGDSSSVFPTTRSDTSVNGGVSTTAIVTGIPQGGSTSRSFTSESEGVEIDINIDEETQIWPDTSLLFEDNPEYEKMKTSIVGQVEENMGEAEELSQTYDRYCRMAIQAFQMQPLLQSKINVWNTDEFHFVMRTFSNHVSEIQEMKLLRRTGMVMLDGQDFSNSVIPYPQSIIDVIAVRLPEIANKRNDDLLTTIKEAIKILETPLKHVEEFVDQLSFLNKISSDMGALEVEFTTVSRLFHIIQEFNIPLTPEQTALFKNLPHSFSQMKATIVYCEAKKEENIRRFSADLDDLIDDVSRKGSDLRIRSRDPMLIDPELPGPSAISEISTLQQTVQTLQSRIRAYASYEAKFGASAHAPATGTAKYIQEFATSSEGTAMSGRAQSVATMLTEIERDLALRRLVREAGEEWSLLVDEWLGMPLDKINVESMQKNVFKFRQTVHMLEKGLPINQLVPKLKEDVDRFADMMPIIVHLKNPALRVRHWAVIEGLLDMTGMKDRSFSFGLLVNQKAMTVREKIQEISTTATNEATLEVMLQKIMDLWQGTNVRLVPHAGRNTYILVGADEIFVQLEESQVTLSSIRGSRFVEPIRDKADEWDRKLTMFSRSLEEWINCQRSWLYLEQIFSTPDITKQLPSESKLFGSADRLWQDLMHSTLERPNALKAATAPGVLESLQQANEALEKVYKCLEDYLETKRLVFPRFYFLSNDELLDILSHSKSADCVQPHLDKCFGNIKSLDIRYPLKQPPSVKHAFSAEGEALQLPKYVRVRGPVEQWLGTVEQGMFDSVKRCLKQLLNEWSPEKFVRQILDNSGQIAITASMIEFCRDVTFCLTNVSPLQRVQQKIVGQLNELAATVLGDLSLKDQQKVEALLTITVHSRDTVESLIADNITSLTHFDWIKQLRFDWNESDSNCYMHQFTSSFIYGYEYLGSSSRLVLTPLTDRCYLTLTSALSLNLGGAPAGPAGTGKTETVKDLAKALGKQCIVFNCSEGLDFKMLGKFFAGLCQSGCWICFDEFNRIDVEVLSVVAQQIYTIKSAKDGTAQRFLFEGKEIKLNPSCGIFVTMNPTYLGRVELPDNLKALFRPVAMMMPDYSLIAEVMLFSQGFSAAKVLSLKIVSLYQLASNQLSQQDHYDFGMRAIKTVLIMAGNKRRMFQRTEGDKAANSPQELEKLEAQVLINSLRDANIPKLIAGDVPTFEKIIGDLFPDITVPPTKNPLLQKAVEMAFSDMGLEQWPSQMHKVFEFFEQLLVRHGVMLVGGSCSGKTVVRTALQRALTILPALGITGDGSAQLVNKGHRGTVDVMTINPKCVTVDQLYGATDQNTLEWSDGLVGVAARRLAAKTAAQLAQSGARSTAAENENRGASREVDADSPPPVHRPNVEVNEPSASNLNQSWSWIVLDGPVDTIWVENLNTVLDDTKMLCLANGERIRFVGGMRVVFEVDSLVNSSPATVSRCAMVYVDAADLGWHPFIQSWLRKLPMSLSSTVRDHLLRLFEHFIPKGFEFLRKHPDDVIMKLPDLTFVTTICHILGALIAFLHENQAFNKLTPKSQEGANDTLDDHTTKPHPEKKEDGGDMIALGSKIDQPRGGKSQQGKVYYPQRYPQNILPFMNKLFLFGFVWSFGGILRRYDDSGEDMSDLGEAANVAVDFDLFCHELFEVEPPFGVRFPTTVGSVYSYFIDLDSGSFVRWDTLIPSTQSLIETSGGSSSMRMNALGGSNASNAAADELIPTIDTIRYSFLAALFLLIEKQPVLLVGESGVGKSALVRNALSRLCKDNGINLKAQDTILGDVLNYIDRSSSLLDTIGILSHNVEDGFNSNAEAFDLQAHMDVNTILGKQTGLINLSLQFSGQTIASRMLSQIASKLIRKGRDVLGAPRGKKLLIFIDDMNTPVPDPFGVQAPMELLRQMVESNGFYDNEKLVWKEVSDVLYLGACGPPEAGCHPLSKRLLKHFCTLAIPQPGARSLQHIYQVRLGRFFREGDFMPDVKLSLTAIVGTAVALYQKLSVTLKPTPVKLWYTFNIRDLTRVVQGMTAANSHVIHNKEQVAYLFAHEIVRVFCDRLVEQRERDTFYLLLANTMHDYFKGHWDAVELQKRTLLYADFLDTSDPSATERIYKPVQDMKQLGRVVEEFYLNAQQGDKKLMMAKLMDSSYHKDEPWKKKLSLVFFQDALIHLVRAARVFRRGMGHLLMVGIDGIGKTTIAQLASQLAASQLFRLAVTRSYGRIEFRDDLKRVFRSSGVSNINSVLLITDGDIMQETIIEDISSILNTGDVPDLFDSDEMDQIIMDTKSNATAAESASGELDSRDGIYAHVLKRVRTNMHVCLAMSPAGDRFRQRCRANPAILSCCTIDVFEVWNSEAMINVAEASFLQVDAFIHPNFEPNVLKQRLADSCVAIHSSAVDETKRFREKTKRISYVTPASYMILLRTFVATLGQTTKIFTNERKRLQIGLQELTEANELVAKMQEELVLLGPQIEQKSHDTAELLDRLRRDTAAVEEVKKLVELEEQKLKQETDIIEKYAKECETDLASVVPQIHAAIQSLDALDKSDIAELRVYSQPPAIVIMVMEPVCALLGQKTDWPTAKLVLKDPDLLRKLIHLDKESIPPNVLSKLRRCTSDPNFVPDKVGEVSVACRSMCQWVLAVQHYNEVYTTVGPKKRRLQEAQEVLGISVTNLERKRETLRKIEHQLSLLKQKYELSIEEQEQLKQKRIITGVRLQRALQLSTALADERVRWGESIVTLDRRLWSAIGDSLLKAAATVYFGPFSSDFRGDLWKQWLRVVTLEYKLPFSGSLQLDDKTERRSSVTSPDSPLEQQTVPEVDLVGLAVEPVQILNWYNNRLPRDVQSLQNAVLIANCQNFPLIIDPQGQAVRWIKSMEGSDLKILDTEDPHYSQMMERAVKVGEAVLIAGLKENLDPYLRSLLRKEIYVSRGMEIILINNAEIEYNKNFRLYLCTEIYNPHYLPSICNMVTLVNFNVTFTGLQEQLLSDVVEQEEPELEHERTNLLITIAETGQLLKELENKSLELIHSAHGHILDDEMLIMTLEQSKDKAKHIAVSLKESEETEHRLEEARAKYLPVAARGATLYHLITDLASIDVMYRFSLAWFAEVFKTSIDIDRRDENIFEDTGGRSSAISTSRGKNKFRQASAGMIAAARQSSASKQSRTTPSPTNRPYSGNEPVIDRTVLLTRQRDMIDRVTSTIYSIVSMAMFADHQPLFSFLLGVRIAIHEKSVSERDWALFAQIPSLASGADEKTLTSYDGLTSIERLEYTNAPSDRAAAMFPLPMFVKQTTWKQCQLLESQLPVQFAGFLRSLRFNEEQWSKLFSDPDPFTMMSRPPVLAEAEVDADDEKAPKPKPIFNWKTLSNFHRLLLIRVLRPDALSFAVRRYVADTIGGYYTEPVSMDLTKLYKQSACNIPIIFILSPGADPTAQLVKFTTEVRGSPLYLDIISLGRGQGARAEELISKAQILRGRWIFLQNCHLANSWMPSLQAIVERFGRPDADIDPQFRLFLSSKPDQSFPLGVLQSGLKTTVEPPRGLKAKLQLSLSALPSSVIQRFAQTNNQAFHFRSLLYGLCFFNAIIQERKKFGPVGWNNIYDFNASDLDVSALQLSQLIEAAASASWTIPWNALRYLTGHVIYGGRVTDNWDRRCLLTMLDHFYCEDALDPEQPFTNDGIYKPLDPRISQIVDVVQQVESLPPSDRPSLFGMDIVADRASREAEANRLISDVLLVEPSLTHAALSESRTPDEVVLDLCADISRRLPISVELDSSADDPTFTMSSALALVEKQRLQTLPQPVVELLSTSALFVVLRQEITRYDMLLSSIHLSTAELTSAIHGDIAVSDKIEALYNSLLSYKLPETWRVQSGYESIKPLTLWVSDLNSRCLFLRHWATLVRDFFYFRCPALFATRQNAMPTQSAVVAAAQAVPIQEPRSVPRAFWLSAFIYPQGFLTAVLQMAARRYHVPVDTLQFKFTVSHERWETKRGILQQIKDGPPAPDAGILLLGLYLDSAKWSAEENCLIALQDAQEDRFNPLPETHFNPLPMQHRQSALPVDEQLNAGYECPVYRTSKRAGILSSTGQSTNFVTTVQLPANRPATELILRGVALLCQLDDRNES